MIIYHKVVILLRFIRFYEDKVNFIMIIYREVVILFRLLGPKKIE